MDNVKALGAARLTRRIAFLTDLHVTPAGESDASWLQMGPPASPDRHPLSALHRLIESEPLQVDYLAVGGDMANQARPDCLEYAWREIHDLSKRLGSAQVLAIPGNHDVDSRFGHNDYDAKGALQRLVPLFPLADEAQSDRFWSRHFVTVEDEYCRFLLLNTSAYHGVSRTGVPPEYLHGRVALSTIDAIRTELQKKKPKAINILICHHHPQKNDDIELTDYSTMEQGELLVKLLAEETPGNWIILHGHKHHPRLAYGSAGGSTTIVMGGGSFSAKLTGAVANQCRNQFYILEIPCVDDELGLDIRGRFFAWTWDFAKGWEKASVGSGLPHTGGFGYRPQFKQLSKEIIGVLGTRAVVRWDELEQWRPQLHYVAPRDLQRLGVELGELGLNVDLNQYGEPLVVGLKP